MCASVNVVGSGGIKGVYLKLFSYTTFWNTTGFLCVRACSLDETVVPHILPTLLGIPDTAHVAVRNTNIKLVGHLSHWINAHQQYLGMLWYFPAAGYTIIIQEIWANARETCESL